MSRPHDDDKNHVDPRPRPWKRAALVALLGVFLWLVLHYLRLGAKSEPEIIYASRYSREFKYRPAASPVITERLKDGRTRVRGAIPSQ